MSPLLGATKINLSTPFLLCLLKSRPLQVFTSHVHRHVRLEVKVVDAKVRGSSQRSP